MRWKSCIVCFCISCFTIMLGAVPYVRAADNCMCWDFVTDCGFTCTEVEDEDYWQKTVDDWSRPRCVPDDDPWETFCWEDDMASCEKTREYDEYPCPGTGRNETTWYKISADTGWDPCDM